MSRYKIAIDIGGTFTDGVMYDSNSGAIWLEKSLTTPADPGEAVSKVAKALLAGTASTSHPKAGAIDDVVHATTLVTNAIIERKGARTALITTKGFSDTLTLRREDRYDLYDLEIEFPDPLVDEGHILELDARITVDGQEIRPASADVLEAMTNKLDRLAVDAVAVCLLHSYVDDTQEQAVAAMLAERFPQSRVSLSSEIAREIREYERTSTTVANAYVQPLTSTYLANLQGRLSEIGITAPLQIMVSSGGFTSADIAARTPVRLLESGPAAGVLSAINTANCVDVHRVLAFDIGGTTAKLCVAIDGQPEITSQFEAGRVRRFKKGSGLPITVPSIDMIEIGAGGGSIAHVGELGLLNVGPQSAGAEPGPACYDRGGAEPTVTDADLMLGYLSADNFLGGAMALSVAAANEAIARLADALALTAQEVAFGINDLVNENMAAAARVHIAEKGLDPRHFSMVATGGAGPVHAVEVAHKLGIKRVLCPVAAGNGSCLGLLIAPPRVDRSWSKPEGLDAVDWNDAQQRLDACREDCVRALQRTGIDPAEIDWAVNLEMRYAGQGDTITVPFGFGAATEVIKPQSQRNFSETYTRLYGRTLPDTAVEIVTWRLVGTSAISTATFAIAGAAPTTDERNSVDRRVFLPEQRQFQDVPVYDRYALACGTRLEAPLILQEAESTIVVARTADVVVLQDGTISIQMP
ncbi:MAG: hydantoinase/oxoprolinase family protein [Hyphomicrobiaceae bacterium]